MTRPVAPAPSMPAPALLTAAALAILALTPAPAAGGPGEPRQPVRMTTAPPRVDLPSEEVVLPLHMFGNRPLVELTLDGRGPYGFILDTGAPTSVIDAGLARELELPEIGRQMLGSPAGGEGREVVRVKAGQARLGGILIHDLEAPTMDLAGLLGGQGAPRGVLSARVFTGARLTLDYPGKRIVISPGSLPEADGQRVFQYMEDGGLPTVTISVAGTTVAAHLDTGSPGALSLPGSYMKSLPLKSEPVQAGRARLMDAEIDLYRSTLDGDLTLGAYSVRSPEVIFADGFPAGNLGYGFLSRFAVTLDFQNSRVRFARDDDAPLTLAGMQAGAGGGGAAARAPGAGPRRAVMEAPEPGGPQRVVVGGSPPKRRYGFMMGGAGGTMTVDAVEPGSPADAGGLKAGDVIVAMNGRGVEKLSTDERIAMLRSSPLALTVERDGRRVDLKMELPD